MHKIIQAVRDHGEALETPAAVVLGDVLRENIRRMQAFADDHGVALRPHVKTHKSVDIALMQIRAGAAGITVSDLHQAEVFAAAGIVDVFVAFPLWMSRARAERACRLLERTELKVGVESRAAVDAIVEQGFSGDDRLELVIEVDCGARRSGLVPHLAGALAEYALSRGLRVAGVFTYPGHGWAHGAAEGAARDQAAALHDAAESLRAAGVEPRIVSAGSTPTAKHSPAGSVTEIRPGEYVFYSMDQYRHEVCRGEDIALFVAATVVSDGPGGPDGPQILDVGTMALGREVDERGGYGWIAGDGGTVARLNEYHGFLDVGDGPRHGIGTVLPLIPNHSCTVVQNVRELLVLEADGTIDRVPVSRFGRPR